MQFEDQHFERKEAGRTDEHGVMAREQISNVKEEITACLSAFATRISTGDS